MMGRRTKRGFTLIELLLYIGIFAISAGIITTIMANSLRIQGNENSATEVTNQLNYTLTTIQRLVQQSSEIEYAYQTGSSVSTPCTSSTTYCSLELRIEGQGSGDPYDPTCIIASSTGVYLEEGGGGATCTATPVLLTNNQITVNSFQFTIYTIPGGNSTVQVNGSFAYNTSNPQLAVTKTLESAIGRVSAATFDSSIIPSADNSISLGQGGSPAYRWQNLYLSGNEYMSANSVLGLGTSTADSSGLTGPGYIYYNTSSSTVRIYNGSSWSNLSPFIASSSNAYFTGGDISIGTSTASTTFYVSGTSSFAGNIFLPNLTANSTLGVNASGMLISTSSSSGGSYWSSSGSNIYNTNSGSVGIGTSTPNAVLAAGLSDPLVVASSSVWTTTGSTFTPTVPSGSKYMVIQAWGGGGGGGSTAPSEGSSIPGGPGGYVDVSVANPTGTVTIKIGAGGTGASSNSSAGSGGSGYATGGNGYASGNYAGGGGGGSTEIAVNSTTYVAAGGGGGAMCTAGGTPSGSTGGSGGGTCGNSWGGGGGGAAATNGGAGSATAGGAGGTGGTTPTGSGGGDWGGGGNGGPSAAGVSGNGVSVNGSSQNVTAGAAGSGGASGGTAGSGSTAGGPGANGSGGDSGGGGGGNQTGNAGNGGIPAAAGGGAGSGGTGGSGGAGEVILTFYSLQSSIPSNDTAAASINSPASLPAQIITQVIGLVTYTVSEIDQYGHQITGGPSPTSNTCPVVSVTGNDRTGTVILSSSTTCSMNFANAYSATPTCVINPESSPSTVETNASTTGFNVSFGTAQSQFGYICQQ